MPSFDIVNKVDPQTLDNALNSARKELLSRFDFKGTKSELDFDKKNLSIHLLTENDLRLNSIVDIIRNRMIKQQLDPKCLDEGKEHYASGNMVKKDIKIKQGIDKDAARKIIKDIKDSGLKVQAQLMDDLVRVSGKKLDDLQSTISLARRGDYGVPLQFVNMKS